MLCSGLGWLVMVMTGLGMIGSLIVMLGRERSFFLAGLGGIIVSLVIGGLCFLLLRVIAEGISVFLDIEANTRETAINSRKIASILEQHAS